MNINNCPACGSDRRHVASGRETVTFKGLDIVVDGMLSTACGNCGYVFVTSEQHDGNVAATRAAHVKQRADAKAAKGLLTGAELRAMREELGLNQKEAAELFGGGPVAFSKYENEDVAQSVAMDRLVRVIHRMGPFGLETLRAALRLGTATKAAPEHAELFVVTFEAPEGMPRTGRRGMTQATAQGTAPAAHDLTPHRHEMH